MRPLDLQSEQFSATGNVASEGVLNQLGRPNLGMITVLIRETVQNSWDARLSNLGDVHFGISGRTLTGEQMRILRQIIFANQSNRLSLDNALASISNFQVLEVYDRGTTGLGGPTRADRSGSDGEPRNFVNLLRNVGLPSAKPLGGGTFGYGKASLYLASSVQTICVHTHCLSMGRLESRFMAAALGSRYETGDTDEEHRHFTGRHWWGRNQAEVVEPVLGKEADDLAMQLGLPTFAADERGTTILILLPVLGELSILETLNLAGTQLLWNCWPKMLKMRQDKHPPITFQLTCEGQPVALPEPRDFPPLQGFAQAMDNFKNRNSDNEETMLSKIIPIECYHPKQRLGLLSLQRFAIKERQEQLISIEESFPIDAKGASHHVALMRKPELIVKYIQGPGLPSSQIEYAGVFVVDEEVDRVFAQSEPPTHDDWSYQSLEVPREKTFVRTAYKRIQEALQDFTSPPPTSNKGVNILPLGGFADRLGGLLLGAEGPGAAIQPFSDRNSVSGTSSGEDRGRIKGNTGVESGKPSKAMIKEQSSNLHRGIQKAKVTLLKKPTLDFIDSMPALLADFVVEHAPNSQATEVQVEVNAVLDGNELEKDPPIGVRVPQVLQWISPDGIQYQGSPQIIIPTTSSGVWRVAVSVPDDVVIGTNLKASEVW